MSAFLDSAYWCVLQVTVVATAGLLLSSALARHSIRQATNLLNSTLLLIGLLTLLAPIPVPTFWSRTQELSVANSETASPKIIAAASSDDTAPMPLIDWKSAWSTVQLMAQHVEAPRRARWTTLRIAGWIAFTCILLGAIRLLISVAYVWKSQRISQPVSDAQLSKDIDRLARTLKCAAPEVRESTAFSCAAVAGWIRPQMILPAFWRDWSDSEREAVLSHEMAHVVRKDAAWRMLAGGLHAVHFFNPLMYLVTNRITLLQELTADATAARLVGANQYLTSLSKLVLQQDRIVENRCSALMPIFAGHLMRRIEMLNSKDGIQSKPERSRFRIALTSLMFACVAVVSVRAMADDDDNRKQSNVRVKVVSSSTETEAQPETVMGFNRAPVALKLLENNRHGLVLIRLESILQHQTLGPLIQGYLGSVQAPLLNSVGIQADAVDILKVQWLAGQLSVVLDQNQESPDSGKHRLSMGSSGAVITMKEPFELKQWVEQYLPDAEAIQAEGSVSYVQSSVAKTTAPIEMKVAISQREDRSVQVGLNPASSPNRALFPTGAATSALQTTQMQRVWKNICGGVVAVVFTDAEFHTVVEPELDGPPLEVALQRFLSEVTQRCTCFGYGIDLVDENEMSLQVRLLHPSYSKAAMSLDSFQKLQGMKRLNSDQSLAVNRLFEKLDAAMVSLQPVQEDGSCELLIQSRLNTSELLAAVMQSAAQNAPESP